VTADRGALLDVVRDRAFADPVAGREVLFEAEQVSGYELLGCDAELAIVRIAHEVADRAFEHQ